MADDGIPVSRVSLDEDVYREHVVKRQYEISEPDEAETVSRDVTVVSNEVFQAVEESGGRLSLDHEFEWEEAGEELLERLAECGGEQEVVVKNSETGRFLSLRVKEEGLAEDEEDKTVRDGRFSGGYEGRRALDDKEWGPRLEYEKKVVFEAEAEVDANGRVTLPTHALHEAGIKRGDKVHLQFRPVDQGE